MMSTKSPAYLIETRLRADLCGSKISPRHFTHLKCCESVYQNKFIQWCLFPATKSDIGSTVHQSNTKCLWYEWSSIITLTIKQSLVKHANYTEYCSIYMYISFTFVLDVLVARRNPDDLVWGHLCAKLFDVRNHIVIV